MENPTGTQATTTPETHATRLLSTIASVKSSQDPETAVQLLKEYDSRMDTIDLDGGGYKEANRVNDIVWEDLEDAVRSVAETSPDEFLNVVEDKYDIENGDVPITVFGVMSLAVTAGYALKKTDGRELPTVLEPYTASKSVPDTHALLA